MTVYLFGLLPLQGVTLLNTWLVLIILPTILFLTAAEPSLNTGKNRYILWVLFAFLFLGSLQINYIAGGWFNLLTIYSLVMYVTIASIGHSNWRHINER